MIYLATAQDNFQYGQISSREGRDLIVVVICAEYNTTFHTALFHLCLGVWMGKTMINLLPCWCRLKEMIFCYDCIDLSSFSPRGNNCWDKPVLRRLSSLTYPVADPRDVTGAYAPPIKNIKNKFLAIFEDFWLITMFLCVSYYWEWPSHLDKANMISYKPPYKHIKTPLCIFYVNSKSLI